MALQVRVFRQIVEAGNLDAAIAVVEEEANAFLQTIAAVDVADVRVETVPVGKYGEKAIHSISVIYAE